MFKKGAILGGQIGAHQERGIFGEFQLHTPFTRIAVYRFAVIGPNHGRQGRLIGAQRIGIRQIPGKDQPDDKPADYAESKKGDEQPEPFFLPEFLDPLEKTARASFQLVGEAFSSRI